MKIIEKYPSCIVWAGIVLQAFGGALGLGILIPAGMLVAGWGLYLFHRARAHPMRYLALGTLSALLPVWGPVLGLLVRPPSAEPSIQTSYRSWGYFLLICGLFMSIATAREGPALALAMWIAAAFSFAAYGLGRLGRPRLALGLFLLNFASCTGVSYVGFQSTGLVRKSNEGATKGNLGALRSALAEYYHENKSYPARLAELAGDARHLRAIPKAKAPPYHRDSTDVRAATAADDAGGWLYNDQALDEGFGRILVNCTHTDSKGSVWTAY